MAEVSQTSIHILDDAKKKKTLYMRAYLLANPEVREKRRLYKKQQREIWKLKLFDALGNVCKRCGFEDRRALQIDHINGGGQADRKSMGYKSGYPYTYYKKILAMADYPARYQLLCANCNWIKKAENNEVNASPVVRPWLQKYGEEKSE